MNRETIAKNINCTDNLTRTVTVDRELDIKIGDIGTMEDFKEMGYVPVQLELE